MPHLSLFTSKWRRKALPKCKWVKINFNSSSKDFPKANKIIAAKVPYFSIIRIRFSSLTGFGFTTTKKF